jgi:hypothetical protein
MYVSMIKDNKLSLLINAALIKIPFLIASVQLGKLVELTSDILYTRFHEI